MADGQCPRMWMQDRYLTGCRRSNPHPIPQGHLPQHTGPGYVADHYLHLAQLPGEVLIALGRHRKRWEMGVVAVGNTWSVPISPTRLLAAIPDHCDGVMLIHNHPVGDPTPSQPDLDFTRWMAWHARQRRMRFLGHLVVGGQSVVAIDVPGHA